MKVGCGKLGRLILILLWVTVGFACAKKNVPMGPGYGAGAGAGGGVGGGGVGSGSPLGLDEARWRELGLNSEAEKREFLQKAQKFENEDVYFDFDSYVLTEPAKKVLDDKAAFLKRYPKAKVTVEGHCDEKGTNEYNLALGEKRATSAQQYLANSGVAAQHLSIVSYGEERPIATGHDEASWAKNRRDHFVVNY